MTRYVDVMWPINVREVITDRVCIFILNLKTLANYTSIIMVMSIMTEDSHIKMKRVMVATVIAYGIFISFYDSMRSSIRYFE